MRKLGSETWLAATLFAASAILAAFAPSQVTGEPSQVVGPATLPVTLALAIAALSFLMLLGSLRKAAAPLASDRKPIWPVMVFSVGLALYVILLPVLGFSLSTAIFLVGLCLLFGERRWRAILPIAVLIPLGLLMFFERFMIILLPGGPWS